MRRKGWLSAAALAIVLLFAGGWFFYTNHGRSVATPAPPIASTPTPPVTPVIPPVAPIVSPVQPATPVAPVPPNFIVPDEVWRRASRLVNADGVEGRGGVQFTEVPIGTKLYAPVDRWHVHIGEYILGGTSFSAVTLSQNPVWSETNHTQSVWFIARWIEVTNFNPRKGEAFAEIRKVFPFPVAYADGKATLIVTLDTIWAERSDRSITDPRAYLWALIQALPPTR